MGKPIAGIVPHQGEKMKFRSNGTPTLRPLFLATSSILAASVGHAQQAPAGSSSSMLDEVIVTSQKREENVQAIPISIEAIDSKKLADLQVGSFDDYARFLPSLSVQSYGPGQAQLYVRGVTNGGDGIHLGSQPLVGVYLDEMPVTTIANNLDVHVYDMARVEALSGPQGTLFGASSMAGTMRLITNKPDPSHFEAGYDVTGQTFTRGGQGGKLEGYVNLPINEKTAVRLVGWADRDPGFINVVRSSPQYYPGPGNANDPSYILGSNPSLYNGGPNTLGLGYKRDNADLVQKNSNRTDTNGGRAAIKFDINDRWTATAMVMAQDQTAYGQWAYTPEAVTVTPTLPDGSSGPSMTLGGTGDLNVVRYFPDLNKDRFTMSTLVIEGKVADLDLTYAGGYIKRHEYQQSDYSDYTLFYDVAYAYNPAYYADNFRDKNGYNTAKGQYYTGFNDFTKQSHEVRLSTPVSWRLHGTVGVFYERQTDSMQYSYLVPGLRSELSVAGQVGAVWYERAMRVDKDQALFADFTFDVTSKLALTGGIRGYHYDNTVDGFAGYSANFPTAANPYTGENICFTPIDPTNPNLPCKDLLNRGTKSGETHRVNVTYKFDDDRMVYATMSTGFRPGGVNRLLTVPPYNPDFLTNYEVGTKTTWLDHRLRINGAVFMERWTDAQFAYPGPNGVNVVINAGRAEVKGLEAEVHFKVNRGLTLSSSATFLDSKLLTNVCHYPSPTFTCTELSLTGKQNAVFAPAGSRLPVSSKFKGNLIARYEWNAGEYRLHSQIAGVYQSDALSSLKVTDEAIVGKQPAYGTVDFALGAAKDSWSAELFISNLFDSRGQALRYTGCAPSVCKLVNVIPTRPRLVGINFSQRF
jgi:outer membrane receptor protein involved in Fe transport